jgi:hypothetical protein
MKKSTKDAAKMGSIAGTIAILCCVSPIILVLFGLSTVTAAIALGNNYFIGASILFLIIAISLHLKKKNQCSVKGIQKNANVIIITIFIAILVYIFWYYFTTWLAELA